MTKAGTEKLKTESDVESNSTGVTLQQNSDAESTKTSNKKTAAWKKRLAKESPTKADKYSPVKTHIVRSIGNEQLFMEHLKCHIMSAEEGFVSQVFNLIYLFQNPETPLRFGKALRTNRMRPMSLSNFRFGPTLGRGSYGRVYLVEEIATRQRLALKIMVVKKTVSYPSLLMFYLTERDALLRLRSPRVVNLHAAFVDPRYRVVCFVFEYCPGGSLKSIIDRLHKIDSTDPTALEQHILAIYSKKKERVVTNDEIYNQCVFVAAELVSAMLYVHKRGIIHLDLKPDNVLISEGGHLKVGDFGLSKRFHWSHSTDRSLCYALYDDFSIDGLGGARCYLEVDMIPFILDRKPREILKHVTSMSDWYSMGVIMYEIFTGFRLTNLNAWLLLEEYHYDVRIKTKSHTQFYLDVIKDPHIAAKVFKNEGIKNFVGRGPRANAIKEFLGHLLAFRVNRLCGMRTTRDVMRDGQIVVDEQVNGDKLNQLALFRHLKFDQLHAQPSPLVIPKRARGSGEQFKIQLPTDLESFIYTSTIVKPHLPPDFAYRHPLDA